MTTKKNLIIVAIRSNSVPKPKLQTEVGPGHNLAVDLQHLGCCLVTDVKDGNDNVMDECLQKLALGVILLDLKQG